jgi:signal transduction histidine kinase
MPTTTENLRHDASRTQALVGLLRLHWFIKLRWIFVLVALGMLAAEQALFPKFHRPWELTLLVLSVGLVNLIWLGVSKMFAASLHDDGDLPERARRSAERFANTQVAVDLLMLTLIIHFTGGVESSLAICYVFHVAISAVLLRRRHAIFQAAWAITLYMAMALLSASGLIGHFSTLPGLTEPQWHTSPRYVAAAILVTSSGIAGVLYFMLHIVARLDTQDDKLRQANFALQRSQTAIQDLQARRARFMQTVAHQLKSPLTVIQTLANLIIDGVVPPDRARPTAEKIAQRCSDGLTQVQELLTLARLKENPPTQSATARTCLRDCVRDLCQIHQPTAQRKGLIFVCDVPEDIVDYARVSEKDARDCIGNLIDNAIKYTDAPGEVHVKVGRIAGHLDHLHPDGGPNVRVPPDCDGFVFVRVHDTGIGIDFDTLRRADNGESLFDAFRRGKNALQANIPGTGLGLSIVREVVEQAGGRVIAYSKLGTGSTFTVLLPSEHNAPDPLNVRDTRTTHVVGRPPVAESQPTNQ